MKANGIAWVTGASRGIGRATALELADRGFRVVASMRDPRAGESLVREATSRGLDLQLARLHFARCVRGFALEENCWSLRARTYVLNFLMSCCVRDLIP